MSDVRQILIHSVRDAIGPNWPLWILAGVGLFTCFLNRSTGRSTAFPPWIAHFLNIGSLSGLLFSITLLYSTSACRRLIRRRSSQQRFKRIAPPDHCSSVFPHSFTCIVHSFSCLWSARSFFSLFSSRNLTHHLRWKSFSRDNQSCGIRPRPYRLFRHNRGVRIGASDLLLLPPSFRDRLHLHLSANGATDICAPDAKRDDS